MCNFISNAGGDGGLWWRRWLMWNLSMEALVANAGHGGSVGVAAVRSGGGSVPVAGGCGGGGVDCLMM